MIRSPILLQNGRQIGFGHPSYIIADAGIRPWDNIQQMKKVIEVAKSTGANAIKFHSFQVEHFLNPLLLRKGEWVPEPEWDMAASASLPVGWIAELKDHADSIGIDLLCAPYDEQRLLQLIDLEVVAIPISGGDITYHDLLILAGKSGLPIFLSTGGARIEEIEEAINKLEQSELVLLQSALDYPSLLQQANLLAMLTLVQSFQILVGYCDQCPRGIVSLGAAALGASVIEKHIVFEEEFPAFGLAPEKFSKMVAQIRQLERAFYVSVNEEAIIVGDDLLHVRRSLYAARDIPQGTVLTKEDIKAVRRNYSSGICPSELHAVIGKTAQSDIPANTLITWEVL